MLQKNELKHMLANEILRIEIPEHSDIDDSAKDNVLVKKSGTLGWAISIQSDIYLSNIVV